MKVDKLIDNLAAKLAAEGAYIEPCDHAGSVTALEQRLPNPLPPSFRSLVTRYSFLPFEVKPIKVFGNTEEQFQDEWAGRLFADRLMSSTLLTNGYIQFACPDTGSYDPICFNTQRKRSDGEYPIVWIDHEGILCYDKISVNAEIAPSFVHLVQAYLASV